MTFRNGIPRRTGTQLAAERTLRLLLPLAMGMLLIVPPQIYFERIFRGQWEGGYVRFLLERVFQFRFYPHGDFGWHHLWFIALAITRVVEKEKATDPPRHVALRACDTALLE